MYEPTSCYSEKKKNNTSITEERHCWRARALRYWMRQCMRRPLYQNRWPRLAEELSESQVLGLSVPILRPKASMLQTHCSLLQTLTAATAFWMDISRHVRLRPQTSFLAWLWEALQGIPWA